MAIVRAAGGKGADLDDSSNIHSGDEPSRTAESNLVAELAGHPAGSRSYLWVRVLGLLLIAITVFLCETLRWDHGSVKIWEVTHTTLEPNATRPALRTSNSEFDGISDERATINTLSEMSSFLTDLERIVNGSVLEFLERKLTDDSVLDGVLHEGAATFVRNGGEALIPEWASNWSGTTNSSRCFNFTWHHYESLVRPFGAFRRLQDKNLHKRRWTWSGVKTGFGRAFGGRRLWMLEFAVCVLLAVGIFANMVPGGFRDAGGYRDAGPRQHAHVGDAGPPFLGTATLKVPPAWSIERAAHYSLRSWISDLILWSSATDLEAHRLGPVAALQVTGSAKELVRELAPDHLANGIHDPQTGQHITGLMLLVRTLATRYAPLDQEASTKAVGEFLNFSKLPNEAVDALLVRFDVLRNRAAQRGGLALKASGMAWILLRALSLPAELLDRLLAQTGGQLPVNEDQLVELMGRIRRQGHLFEQGFKTSFKQGGTGDPGAYFYPTFAGAEQEPGMPSSAYGTPYPGNPLGGCSPTGFSAGPPVDASSWNACNSSTPCHHPPRLGTYHSQDEEQCPTCGMYYADDDISSCTSSEDGETGSEVYAAVNVGGETLGDEASIGAELYHLYKMAKRKWRRFSGRPPRRYRKFSYKPKDATRLQRTPYSKSYASFLPASSFAGGKGHGGKGKSKGRTNPRGKDGKVLRCNKCNSDQHLWRQCPLLASQSQNHLVTAEPPALTLHSTPAPNTGESNPASSSHGARSLPGVTFSSHFVSAVSSPSRTGVDVELDRLSQVSAASGRNKRRADEMRQGSSCQDRPPAWEPGRPSSWSSQVGPDDSVSQTGSAAAGVQTLIPGASLPKHPPPQNSPPHVSEQERSKATLQLQSLLFAWWESPVDDPKAEAKQAGLCDIYHERTRVHGKVGLLVDPGAHDNLCGSNTMELMADQLGCQVEAKELSRPLNVQGVGKGSQQARVSHSLKFALKADGAEQVSGSFNTPIVPDSDLPPLLGLKSLKRSKAILDTHGQKLIIPGPGGVEMIMSPGSLVFPLEMSDSGHLILPVHASTHDAVSAERTLDFPSSRACASPSGADRNVRRLSSFRPDEVNCAADRAGDAGGGLQ